ncbi:MAG: diphosphate--fructose-6-phosphate 1-phosphotransferase [Bdellovibrionota bacterium]
MKSQLQIERSKYEPKLPKGLKSNITLREGEKTTSVKDEEEIKKLFPNTYGMPLITFEQGEEKKSYNAVNVGVILSGGQAPGGHNVIAGIFDGVKSINSESKLYGFLGGPAGLVDNKYIEITAELVDEYRNTGGFDIIGSGRTKLEEKEQFDKALENCKKLGISALVMIGGDDSNTNACILAEYYISVGADICVVGCPKTIDGDLQNEMIDISFGFDTACKVYSELIGNIERDTNSAKKYWHFVKLMGRSASHIALECALQTHPNITIISEEVAEKKQTLNEIVEYIASIVAKRGNDGKNFGVALIPEGLIEFIPDMKTLISDLNDLLANNEEFNKIDSNEEKRKYVASKLSKEDAALYASLPVPVAEQLIMDRDPHGNVQVSRIETEKLLISMVEKLLKDWKNEGKYKGKFSAINHFFGYEGRCAAPSNFDADYCYSLGFTASYLLSERKTGYMASIRNITKPSDEWVAGGVPITMMMNIERRHGKMKPVIQKALVDLNGKAFKELKENREAWAFETHYVYPGPIQYFGPSSVCDNPPYSIKLLKA